MDKNEVSEFVASTCKDVLSNLAQQYQAPNLSIRIDMEKVHGKPVYALFDGSTFLARCSLKDIIRAGGGIGMYLLISMEIVKILRQIFTESMKRFDFHDPKLMYIRLFLATNQEPKISIVKEGQCVETVSIIEATGNE